MHRLEDENEFTLNPPTPFPPFDLKSKMPMHLLIVRTLTFLETLESILGRFSFFFAWLHELNFRCLS